MAELQEQRREVAERFRSANAEENELTAQQARLFVRSIQNTWGVTPLEWSPRQSAELFGDARRLIHASTIFEEADGKEAEAATSCYRRAGEILEWLARSGDTVTRDVPVGVLSAAAYQLAGLPAMANALLKRAPLNGAGAVIGAFLACDFDTVMSRTQAFWQLHEGLTGRHGSAGILDGEGTEGEAWTDEGEVPAADGTDRDDDDDAEDDDGDVAPEARGISSGRLAWYVVVETVRVLGLIAEGIRRGEELRISVALEKLDALSELATRWASDEAWVLLRLLRSAAHRFVENSLHRRAAALAITPAGALRLRRFGREQFARGRGVLWASQVKGLDRLVGGRAFALCTPTGSGKTLVANLALVKELLLVEPSPGAPSRLALYLVPSRALAGEVEAKLSAEFRGQLTVTGLYGGTDWGITDYWLTADTPTVLIATVEKAEALMRYVGHLLTQRLELLIVDEAHQVVVSGDARTMRSIAAHGDRAFRLESLVSRLLTLKPSISRIALTAVAGGAAAPVARWVEGSVDAVPVGLGYRSSRQLVGVLECRPKQPPRVSLELNNGQPLYVRNRDQPVFLGLSIAPMPDPPLEVRNSLHHYVQVHALWTALHLTSSGRRILVSVTQAPDRVMRRYAEAFEFPGWSDLPAFKLEDEISRQLFDEARAACVDYCGLQSSELKLLDRGIATSHGQMPQRLRRLMVDLIDRRICPITVATATLTEGVNLPFDLIILPSLERTTDWTPAGIPVPGVMPTAEFRNLAGRAGRPGAAESMEGMTLICLPLGNSATANGKQQEQRNQRGNYLANFNVLLDALVREEASSAVVSAPLQTLLKSIWEKLRDNLNVRTEADLHTFLERMLPETVGNDLGVGSKLPMDLIGDSLDELDGLILASLDEVERLSGAPADVESALRGIWSRTFTRYAGAVEAWMEAAFVKRGQGVVERLYPDPFQRRQLYQIGFTPYVGRQFQVISPQIIALLRGAATYGRMTPEERFTLFWRLGELVRPGRGYGYTGKSATELALIPRWHEIAGWWLQREKAPPPLTRDLRRWQMFVANNLEYRLGVAVGAAVAEAWNAGAVVDEIPSIDAWRSTTGLPWIGFWFRELVRWGTMDPFVAFAMAQGIAGTREVAGRMRTEFEAWLVTRDVPVTDEDLIDPQLYMEWNRSRPRVERAETVNFPLPAALSEVDGTLKRYAVRPMQQTGGISWLDPAGFRIARSAAIPGDQDGTDIAGHDFEIANDQFGVRVSRTF